jgi:hypothetical protein
MPYWKKKKKTHIGTHSKERYDADMRNGLHHMALPIHCWIKYLSILAIKIIYKKKSLSQN